jgi:hypothetical protein
MHHAGTESFTAKLSRHPLKENVAKMPRHHLRCLHDLVKLAIAKRDHTAAQAALARHRRA